MHEVETMAYAKQGGVPWHGLGFEVSNDLSVDEMLVAAKLDWEVTKAPIQVIDGPKVPNKYALVRSTDKKVLDLVGSTYNPVQNKDAFSFFKKFVEAGHMTMETAGSLRGGQFVWGLAKINSSFTLPGDDRVEGYLLVSQPHKIGKSMIIQFTPIRVVCMNTLSYALGSGIRAGTTQFRMPHVKIFDESMKVAAERALGLANRQLDEFQKASELLAGTPMPESKVMDYFYNVFGLMQIEDPSGKTRISPTVELAQAAMNKSPGSQLESAKGTVWGAVNAVTYVIDYQLGKSRDTALAEAWFGHRATIKRRAVEEGLKIARAA